VSRTYSFQNYDTRFDRFRAREKLDPQVWAQAAGMSRSQLNNYRIDHQSPRVTTLARLVRAASRLVRRPVRASELADLGEEEPLGSGTALAGTARRTGKSCGTRLDELLRKYRIRPLALAEEAGLTRQLLLRHRENPSMMRASTLEKIVRALRRNGIDVRAADVADVGEGPG
jgi:DNA-binding Xre family transcriptional regulator